MTDEKLKPPPPLTQNSCSSGPGSDSGEDEVKPAVRTVKDEKDMDYSLTQIARGEYNSPACSTKSSSSVEVLKTVAPFKMKDDALEVFDVDYRYGERDDEEDQDDINVQDIEPESDTKSKKGETEEEASDTAVDTVDEVGTGGEIEPDFVCVGCGNGPDSCHQYLYGGWLVQEAISLFDEMEPHEITEQDIIHRMQYKYNTQISFACWHEIKMYDSSCWYEFPGCLSEGAVEYAKKVIKNQQVFLHLRKRRQGGIAIRTLRNNGTKDNI